MTQFTLKNEWTFKDLRVGEFFIKSYQRATSILVPSHHVRMKGAGETSISLTSGEVYTEEPDQKVIVLVSKLFFTYD